MNWDEWHANSATLARKLGLFELAVFYEECRVDGWFDPRGNREEILSECRALNRRVRDSVMAYLTEGSS